MQRYLPISIKTSTSSEWHSQVGSVIYDPAASVLNTRDFFLSLRKYDLKHSLALHKLASSISLLTRLLYDLQARSQNSAQEQSVQKPTKSRRQCGYMRLSLLSPFLPPLSLSFPPSVSLAPLLNLSHTRHSIYGAQARQHVYAGVLTTCSDRHGWLQHRTSHTRAKFAPTVPGRAPVLTRQCSGHTHSLNFPLSESFCV